MNPAWALNLPIRAGGELGRLRCDPGLEILETRDELWLRGDQADAVLSPAIACLPAFGRYWVREDLKLVPLHKRLPVGELAVSPWVKLSEWLEVEMPVAALCGQAGEAVKLTLQRTGKETQPNLLITGRSSMRAWAEYASGRKLAVLSVAIDRVAERVAVRGVPLPPLPGARYVVEGRVGLPAGHGFALPISNREVADMLDVDRSSVALFHTDGSWSLLPDDVFVAATRGTLRLLGSPDADVTIGGSG